MCRAQYDLDERTGGFCCQSVGAEFDGTKTVTGMMTTATGVSAADEPTFTVSMQGMDIDFSLGAEVFGSASGLAASAVTMAAACIAFNQ